MSEPPSGTVPSSVPASQFAAQLRETPLYAIVDTTLRPELSVIVIAEMLLRGGARIIQYRHKGKFGRGNFEECCGLARRIHEAGGLFVVNDRADVAELCGADGVHLGHEDLPPDKARSVISSGKIMGYSTHNLEQAKLAGALPVDYIALGPIFTTQTKQNPDPVVGLSLVSAARRLISRPLIAIGGITLERAASLLRTGADGVAIASDLLKHPDIEMRTRESLAVLREACNER